MLTATVIDFCLGDFLQDHHNRDGECMLGVFPHGQNREAIADDFVSELNSLCDFGPPEKYDNDMVRAAVVASLKPDAKIWPVDDCGNDITDMDLVPEDSEQPQLWILLEWEEDSTED